jgi:hypothetical protein
MPCHRRYRSRKERVAIAIKLRNVGRMARSGVESTVDGTADIGRRVYRFPLNPKTEWKKDQRDVKRGWKRFRSSKHGNLKKGAATMAVVPEEMVLVGVLAA